MANGYKSMLVALIATIAANITPARAENILLTCHFDSEDHFAPYKETDPAKQPIRVDINEQRVMISGATLFATLPQGSIADDNFIIKISAFEIHFGQPYHTIGKLAFQNDARIDRETGELTYTLVTPLGDPVGEDYSSVHYALSKWHGKCVKYDKKNPL